MSENDCLRSELKSRCGRPGPGRDLAITRCNYGNGRRRQFNNFKTQNPGRRANTPTTLTAFQMEPSQAAGAAVPVQITVLRGRNLKGTKGESCLTFIRAEFNGVVLGDSQKLEASADQGVEYNFPCSFECAEGSNTLDDLAHKPVVLTLYETLPKEKKQKDEKTLVLGQAIVGLLPLLQGQNTFSITAPLQAAPGSPGDGGVLEGSDKPSLDVAICVPEALLSEAQLADSNLLKVAVEAAYSVPEAWATTGPPFNYVAAMQVPLTAEREQLLAFSGGALKPGGEREPVPRPKKWPVGPSLTPGAQYIPGALIEGQPIEGENGELTGLEDRDFRVEAESIQKRVIWDTERCCFLEGGALGRLAKRIADCRFWPVEIMRAQVNTGKAVKAGKDRGGEDDAQLSFHGVAYVDMAPLLYPGVKRIRGAYQILPFYEADLLAKTKRQGSVLRDSLRQTGASGKVRVPSSLGSPHLKGAPSKILKDDKGAKEASKKASAERVAQKPQVSDSVAEVDVGVPLNTEGQMYAEARTYIVIEIALDRPLVPKRLPEELAKRVAELIPPRPPLPRRPAGAERAVRDFHGQVANVTGLLLDQYHELFGAATARGELPLDVCAQEERKTRLLGELNYSGKYFAFKEQMKHSVVRIVREKMLRTEAFAEPEELQAFLSQLYIFLVDEMHVSLNKSQSKDVQDTEPQPYLDSAQLRHFAREAQMNEDFQLAAQYYQERLAQDRSAPAHWFDYGTFCMLTGEHAKAEECFHQAVAIDQRHLSSLLLCGILAEMGTRFGDAETFFEDATCVDPSSVVAWTLFGLFYEGQENAIQAEMAFLEANKQLKVRFQGPVTSVPQMGDRRGSEPQEGAAAGEAQEPAGSSLSTERHQSTEAEGDEESVASVSDRAGAATAGGGAEPEPEPPAALKPLQSRPGPPATIYMETAHFLLENNALQMAQRALAQELLCPDGGPSSCYHLALARLHLQRAEYDQAEGSLKTALQDSFENPDAWALSGHVHYLTGGLDAARQCYERTLDFTKDASEMHPVYLRLGNIYLQEQQFGKAKLTYLRACKKSPSCLSWLGLGTACYRLGELTEAEDALTEANTLNNANPEVWGYLSLVCLQTGRRLEAEQAYKYAVKLNLQKGTLLQEIHQLQQRVGFGNPSF
ncbi:cilia- and flagella-associated protein 70 isoform X1 [Amia ocellicauda]|uniref:cilia- and flagella-associated protein 70 isoform X1 n=1 Tax=Amia ocellicauda TaxID=2972642 RepID=UPI003463BE68